MNNIRIGIIGVTGLVGKTLLALLCDDNTSTYSNNIKVCASDNSVGITMTYNNNNFQLARLDESFFDLLDVVFFCADTNTSTKWVGYANSRGVFVIDNSSAFRLNTDVPLVIPEINGYLIEETEHGLIANPNCCTAILCMAIFPLLKLSEIKRIDVSTYQAVSGAGQAGITELTNQCNQFTRATDITSSAFPSQIFANCFSHNTPIDEDTGYCEEELKMIWETRKILNRDIEISATCVRIPVFTSHSESVKITFENPVLESDIRSALQNFKGVKIMDDIQNGKFPEPVLASGQTDIFVGRIRRDYFDRTNTVYHMFICGDQLLKGASYNAFQIFKEYEKITNEIREYTAGV